MAQILRVRRTDRPKEHLLINITQTGSRPLDLKLVATDQEHIFHQTTRDNSVDSLRSTQAGDDLQTWKSTLLYVLLRKSPDGPLPDFLRGAEAIASISKQSVNLRIQKNIDGITQRLGTITLDQDDEREEVSAFDWVDAAVASSDEVREQLETLQLSLASQQDEVTKLTEQLDELIKAKKEHEEELLSKFTVLLNSKKQKIRDQQRLLSGAKVDLNTTEAVHKAQSSESSAKSRKPGASRARKRRAEPSLDASDQGQDGEEMSGVGPGDGTDADADTATDTDDDGDDRKQETPQDSDEDMGNEDGPPLDRGVESVEEPPPRRELPFKRKPPPTKEAPSRSKPSRNVEEDDEETDDEL